MTKKLFYIGLMSTAMLFTACSGDSDNQKQKSPVEDVKGLSHESPEGQMETTSNNEKVMELNKAYVMSKGESIKKISSNPKIVLETNLETGETTATLLKGEAKIKKSSIAFF